ncbi:hypothetical protein F4678DRAFT_480741 [Xylaria arbuscula]|nr:hypothetical protein F4678DRAFT_480741 [Xylaria arbuscula]
MSPKTLYEVLSVSSDADGAAIEKAFKALSLKWHPDKANVTTVPSGGETQKDREIREKHNHDRFTRMVEARDILTNPAKRQQYDQERRPKKDRSNRRSESSKHSKPSTSRKDSRQNNSSSQRTARQGTKLDQEHDHTVHRIRRLRPDFADWLYVFRTRKPPSESRFKDDYLDVLILYDRVVRIDHEITEDLVNNKMILRDRGSASAMSTYENSLFEADLHILRMQTLFGELMSRMHLPIPLLFNELFFALSQFLDEYL